MPLQVAWLQPDDGSPVAVLLASDAAAMITGAKDEVTAGDSAKFGGARASRAVRGPIDEDSGARGL